MVTTSKQTCFLSMTTMAQRSKDDSCEAESHNDDGDNLCPGGQVQVPPGEEQTPPCSHGGSQTTVNKEEPMSKSLVKINKSSHHHGIIWSGKNSISRASSSFQMEIRSAKRWKIGRTFAELIRKCAKDGSGKRLSGKVSRKPHHENNMSQCVKMENKLSFWFSEQRDEGLREQGANNLKIFALMNHSGHDV